MLDQYRGNGYWLWNPLLILDALSKVNDGDYVFYLDSGVTLIDDIHLLINAMDAANTNIMTFLGSSRFIEKAWTKRDAFILMDCDSPEYTDTPQLGSGFAIFKKSAEAINFVEDWLRYMTDARIVTDIPNQLGKPNYPEFQENRHDQTVLSLLSKKKKLPLFRISPSSAYPKDVIERSPYPHMFDINRRRNWTMTFDEYLKMNSKKTILSRGLECVCVLMVEKFYSEALKMLLHIINKSPNVTGGGWNELKEILRLANESDDKLYGEFIRQSVYKIMTSMLNGGMRLDIVIISDLISIAQPLNRENNVERQLKDQITAIAMMVARDKDKFADSMAWIKDIVDRVIKYLIDNGHLKVQTN